MGKIIHLESPLNRWEFNSDGGRLVRWQALDGETWRDVVRGNPALLPSADAHRAAVMFPWVNRLGGDEWEIEGERVPVDHSARLSHLHGVVADSPFTVLTNTSDTVKFSYDLEPEKYYPRHVRITAEYSIANLAGREALLTELTATNLETKKQAYVTMGTHPYFVNPFGGPVDAMNLFCAAAQEFAIDEAMIPTGLMAVTPEHDFGQSRPIADTQIDHAFVLQSGVSPAAALTLKNFEFEIHPLNDCGYLQIYIPPNRTEIALEPQSGGADAYHQSEYGLTVLSPGESTTFKVMMTARFNC